MLECRHCRGSRSPTTLIHAPVENRLRRPWAQAMVETSRIPRLIRFGQFEFDFDTRELRRRGLKIKIAGQPLQILMMLLERPGEVITREQIQGKLWPADTFVQFE